MESVLVSRAHSKKRRGATHPAAPALRRLSARRTGQGKYTRNTPTPACFALSVSRTLTAKSVARAESPRELGRGAGNVSYQGGSHKPSHHIERRFVRAGGMRERRFEPGSRV